MTEEILQGRSIRKGVVVPGTGGQGGIGSQGGMREGLGGMREGLGGRGIGIGRERERIGSVIGAIIRTLRRGLGVRIAEGKGIE
jgi:hypothetical protein